MPLKSDRGGRDEQALLELADQAYASLMSAAGVLSEMTERLRTLLGEVERGEAEFDEALIGRIETMHREFGALRDEGAEHD